MEAEYQCPLCETIVSAYESSCYECGCIFEPGAVDDEDSDRLALSYYDSKLLRSPENKDLWYARGATLIKIEEYEQALNSFNRALELDKTFQAAWMSKAEVYNKLGDSTKAAECYSHIITSASAGMDLGGGDDDDESMGDLELDEPASEEHESEPAEKPEEDEPEPEVSPEDELPSDDNLMEELPELATSPEVPDTEAELVEEPVIEQEPEIVETGVETVEETTGEMPDTGVETDEKTPGEMLDADDETVYEETEEMSDEPEPEAAANGPEVMKPHSYDDVSSSDINIDMDYTKPEPEKPVTGSRHQGGPTRRKYPCDCRNRDYPGVGDDASMNNGDSREWDSTRSNPHRLH